MSRYPLKEEFKIRLKCIGDECKRARVREGISIREMAKKTGFDKSSIQSFELGLNNSALIYEEYLKYLRR